VGLHLPRRGEQVVSSFGHESALYDADPGGDPLGFASVAAQIAE
jgi:hypothetical protein